MTDLKELFIKYYGESSEEIRFFTSPGRVNLIGEHVDYCGGLVFPAALTLSSVAAVRLNNSDVVNLRADDLDGLYSFNLNNTEAGKDLKWGNYQAGVIHWLKENGYKVRGMDFLFSGNIPFGSGLSSSAAFEVLVGVVFEDGELAVIPVVGEILLLRLDAVSGLQAPFFSGRVHGLRHPFVSV